MSIWSARGLDGIGYNIVFFIFEEAHARNIRFGGDFRRVLL